MELKSVPEQRRTAREHILILAYEKYQRDHEEIQELRMSRDNSRSVLLNSLTFGMSSCITVELAPRREPTQHHCNKLPHIYTRVLASYRKTLDLRYAILIIS